MRRYANNTIESAGGNDPIPQSSKDTAAVVGSQPTGSFDVAGMSDLPKAPCILHKAPRHQSVRKIAQPRYLECKKR